MKERTLWPVVLGIATLVGITIGVSRCAHKNDKLTEDHERERHFDDSALTCEQWIAGWREQCTHRSYRQHDSIEFRSTCKLDGRIHGIFHGTYVKFLYKL